MKTKIFITKCRLFLQYFSISSIFVSISVSGLDGSSPSVRCHRAGCWWWKMFCWRWNTTEGTQLRGRYQVFDAREHETWKTRARASEKLNSYWPAPHGVMSDHGPVQFNNNEMPARPNASQSFATCSWSSIVGTFWLRYIYWLF